MADVAPGSEGEKGQRPRSLYHKEKAAPLPRDRFSPSEPSGDSGTPRRGSNPGWELMLANLRRFGAFLGGMLLLMLVSILVLKFLWGIRDRELRSPRPERPVPASASRAPAEAGGTGSTQQVAEAPQGKTELDTELIRRAVFLSKHGQALEDSRNYTEAIARYREALDIWPYLTSVWGQLGKLYLRTREFGRAQIALEKAVENNPGSAELLNDLGVAFLYQGRVDKATHLFEAAVEVDPNYAASHFNLALCHLTRNDRVSARGSLERFLRMKPHDARALREAAFLNAMETRYQEALESLQKALSEAPDWPLLYFDAAAVSALMGRPDEAIRYLEKAEPLSTPTAVYKLYQEPAFREIRLTELGKLFEKELAARARERAGEEAPAPDLHSPSEPISSVSQ